MNNTLALFGGTPVRNKPFPPFPVLGKDEHDAVLDVLREGRLSMFIASPGEFFGGGKRIQRFEQEFAEYHGVKYAVAFNSATAALHAAVVGVGLEPGEEIITTPYTFTSSATCALMHNAIPLFADVDRESFNISPASIKQTITPLTRALIPVHLFGNPAPMDEILKIAKESGLKVIEDVAQAPGARYNGRLCGTMGDCGVFSFQETKNMMTGEGGMLITNDERITEVARLIRNHGEAVAHTMTKRSYASETLGYNYRMTEFEAAIGRVQLKHLDESNAVRQQHADYLTKHLRQFPGITPPKVEAGSTHVYYVYPFIYDETQTGIPRKLFAEALQAEGIPLGVGYVKPLYYSPLFQERRAFAFKHYKGNARYDAGLCPVAEELHFKKLLLIPVVRPPATTQDMDDIVLAVEKIMKNRSELQAQGRPQSALATAR
jgi:perosamine synthetase